MEKPEQNNEKLNESSLDKPVSSENRKPDEALSKKEEGVTIPEKKESNPQPILKEAAQEHPLEKKSDDLAELKMPLPTFDKNKILLICNQNDPSSDKIIAFLKSYNIEVVHTIQRPEAMKPIAQVYNENRNIQFGIVLMNADNFCYSRGNGSPKDQIMISHTKIIFELGYWIGKLGRDKVVALYYDQRSYRCPTEFCDAMYIPLDKKGAWKSELKVKMKSCGFAMND